jgi:hypothetical protein
MKECCAICPMAMRNLSKVNMIDSSSSITIILALIPPPLHLFD